LTTNTASLHSHTRESQVDNSMSVSNDQIQECFSIFDKDNDNRISIEELGPVLRSLGKNPTNAELNAIKDELKAKDFDIGTLKIVYRKPIKGPTDQSKEMLDAFKALDKEGNGQIQETELRQLLLNLGDALTSAEVEEIMNEVPISPDGSINYDAFVDMIVTGYPTATA